MHLQVAAVDAVVVGDDDLRQLDVLALNRLQGPVEGGGDEVEAVEGTGLEPLQLLLVLNPHALRHQPTFPDT